MGEDDMFETTFHPLQICKINWSQKPSHQRGELQAPEQGKKSAMGSINSISALAAKVGLIGRYVISISVVVQVPSALRWGLISLW
jgi:hypothetical protein